MAKQNGNGEKVKSMEAWIWDAAFGIRRAISLVIAANIPLLLHHPCNHKLLPREQQRRRGSYK